MATMEKPVNDIGINDQQQEPAQRQNVVLDRPPSPLRVDEDNQDQPVVIVKENVVSDQDNQKNKQVSMVAGQEFNEGQGLASVKSEIQPIQMSQIDSKQSISIPKKVIVKQQLAYRQMEAALNEELSDENKKNEKKYYKPYTSLWSQQAKEIEQDMIQDSEEISQYRRKEIQHVELGCKKSLIEKEKLVVCPNQCFTPNVVEDFYFYLDIGKIDKGNEKGNIEAMVDSWKKQNKMFEKTYAAAKSPGSGTFESKAIQLNELLIGSDEDKNLQFMRVKFNRLQIRNYQSVTSGSERKLKSDFYIKEYKFDSKLHLDNHHKNNCSSDKIKCSNCPMAVKKYQLEDGSHKCEDKAHDQIKKFFKGTLHPLCSRDHDMRRVQKLPLLQKDQPICGICKYNYMICQEFYFECSQCDEYMCMSCGAMDKGLVKFHQDLDNQTFEYEKQHVSGFKCLDDHRAQLYQCHSGTSSRDHGVTSSRWVSGKVSSCLKCLLKLSSSEARDPFEQFYACEKKNFPSFFFQDYSPSQKVFRSFISFQYAEKGVYNNPLEDEIRQQVNFIKQKKVILEDKLKKSTDQERQHDLQIKMEEHDEIKNELECQIDRKYFTDEFYIEEIKTWFGSIKYAEGEKFLLIDRKKLNQNQKKRIKESFTPDGATPGGVTPGGPTPKKTPGGFTASQTENLIKATEESKTGDDLSKPDKIKMQVLREEYTIQFTEKFTSFQHGWIMRYGEKDKLIDLEEFQSSGELNYKLKQMKEYMNLKNDNLKYNKDLPDVDDEDESEESEDEDIDRTKFKNHKIIPCQIESRTGLKSAKNDPAVGDQTCKGKYNGDTYESTEANGTKVYKMHGYGKFKLQTNKDTFDQISSMTVTGDFKDNMKDGQCSVETNYIKDKKTIMLPDCDYPGNITIIKEKFDGIFKKDQRHGEGTLIQLGEKNVEVSRYIGYHKKNMMNGYGTQTITFTHEKKDDKGKKIEEQHVFKGTFKSNKRHGQGRLVVKKNGKLFFTFEGEFKQDMKHGYGKCEQYDEIAKNKLQFTYEGNFKEAKRVGYGKLNQLDQGWIYQGVFDENEQCTGKGMLQLPDGTTKEGNLKKRNLEGHGTLKQWDGLKYEGEWIQKVEKDKLGKEIIIEKRNGKGKQEWPDGKEYDGHWKMDKMDGHGTCKWANGNEYIGFWEQDDMHDLGKRGKSGELCKQTDQAMMKYSEKSYFQGIFDHNVRRDGTLVVGEGSNEVEMMTKNEANQETVPEHELQAGFYTIKAPLAKYVQDQNFKEIYKINGEVQYEDVDGVQYKAKFDQGKLSGHPKQLNMPILVILDDEDIFEIIKLDDKKDWDLVTIEHVVEQVTITKEVEIQTEINTWQPLAPDEPKPLEGIVLNIGEAMSIPPKEPQKHLVQQFRKKLPDFEYGDNVLDNQTQIVDKMEIQLPDGSKYIGQWNQATKKREGKGVQIWPDGSFYEGWWKNDMFEGLGRLIKADLDVYVGDWSEDKASGEGKFIHNNGATYNGSWKDNLQDGEGEETWKDGTTYRGQYKDGQKNGYGRFTWSDGSKYTGDIRNNQIEGQGRYTWEDGREFIGEWKANKMHGSGVFTWLDGKKYKGNYYKDKKHGQGIFTWPDGRKYDGQWKSGKQYGHGVFTWKDGRKYDGMWRDGLHNGLGYYCSKGVISYGNWVNGVRKSTLSQKKYSILITQKDVNSSKISSNKKTSVN